MANFIEFRYLKKKGSMPGPSKVKCQAQRVTNQGLGGSANVVAHGNIVAIQSPGQITLADALVWIKSGSVWGSCIPWNRVVVRVMDQQGQDQMAFAIHPDPAHADAERASLAILEGETTAFTIQPSNTPPPAAAWDVRDAPVQEGAFETAPGSSSKFIHVT